MDENAAKLSTNPPSKSEAEQAKTNENIRRPTVRDLFEWKSLSRPMWQYPKDVYTTFGAIAILVAIILAFFQEWMAILAVAASYFLFYALSKVPPMEVSHKITTQGVVSMDKAYLWSELGPFWFVEKGNDLVLHIAHRNLFGQLIILLSSPADKEPIQDLLAEYLPFIEMPEKSASEKMVDWFSKKFPIEKMTTRNFKASDTSAHSQSPTESTSPPATT